jgi:hypothetical protein
LAPFDLDGHLPSFLADVLLGGDLMFEVRDFSLREDSLQPLAGFDQLDGS